MPIRITATDAQEAAIASLVAEWPDHDAWIDFVTTDEAGRIWVRFTHPVHQYHYYVLNADGSHDAGFDGSAEIARR